MNSIQYELEKIIIDIQEFRLNLPGTTEIKNMDLKKELDIKTNAAAAELSTALKELKAYLKEEK